MCSLYIPLNSISDPLCLEWTSIVPRVNLSLLSLGTSQEVLSRQQVFPASPQVPTSASNSALDERGDYLEEYNDIREHKNSIDDLTSDVTESVLVSSSISPSPSEKPASPGDPRGAASFPWGSWFMSSFAPSSIAPGVRVVRIDDGGTVHVEGAGRRGRRLDGTDEQSVKPQSQATSWPLAILTFLLTAANLIKEDKPLIQSDYIFYIFSVSYVRQQCQG